MHAFYQRLLCPSSSALYILFRKAMPFMTSLWMGSGAVWPLNGSRPSSGGSFCSSCWRCSCGILITHWQSGCAIQAFAPYCPADHEQRLEKQNDFCHFGLQALLPTVLLTMSIDWMTKLQKPFRLTCQNVPELLSSHFLWQRGWGSPSRHPLTSSKGCPFCLENFIKWQKATKSKKMV